MDYHDALAALGVGSAHPGGYAATLAWVEMVDLRPGARVLEVGCGTGRTACLLADRFGCRVTGVDLRRAMIDRAVRRAELAGVDVHFQKAGARRLPFPEASFDALVAESVTVFNPPRPQLREYLRVLRPGGFAVDVEMCAAGPVPADIMRSFQDLYGAVELPTMIRWKALYSEAGFAGARILLSGSAAAMPLKDDIPDAPATAAGETALSPAVAAIVRKNGELMARAGCWLNFAVIRAEKPAQV